MRRWLAAGVEMGWVSYPKGRTVTVYRTLDNFQILTVNGTLDGEDVLPGLRYRVADLFSALGS